MSVATSRAGATAPFEVRIRFEPGLGASLYASLVAGEVGHLTVARALGRGRALLSYRGVTLMAQGAPDWRAGDTFPVYVKQLGPPLVLAAVESWSLFKKRAPVTTVDSAVVPGTGESPRPDARP